MKKIIIGVFVILVATFFVAKPALGQGDQLLKKIQQVLVINDSTQAIPVEVTNQQNNSTQWELTSTCNGYTNYFANKEARLNTYASEGWELVDVESIQDANTVCEYYKRPLVE